MQIVSQLFMLLGGRVYKKQALVEHIHLSVFNSEYLQQFYMAGSYAYAPIIALPQAASQLFRQKEEKNGR